MEEGIITSEVNIITVREETPTEDSFVFGEREEELVKFPVSSFGSLGGGGSGDSETPITSIPNNYTFVNQDSEQDSEEVDGDEESEGTPLETEEGWNNADSLGGVRAEAYARKNMVGDAFDEEKAYAVGDLCIYGDHLYKFVEAKEAGAWSGESVVPTSLGEEIGLKDVHINPISNDNYQIIILSSAINRIKNIAIAIMCVKCVNPSNSYVNVGTIDVYPLFSSNDMLPYFGNQASTSGLAINMSTDGTIKAAFGSSGYTYWGTISFFVREN